MKKEATDLKGSMERYIAGLGGRRGNGKYCNYIMTSKRVILSMIFYYTSFEYLNGLPAYFENWPNFKKKSNLTYYISSMYILRNYIAKLVSRIFSWEQMYSQYQVKMLSVEQRRDTTKSSTISNGALINGILFLGKYLYVLTVRLSKCTT